MTTSWAPVSIAPPFAVHGELTADGQHIVLIAAGDAETAADHLTLLTPAFAAVKGQGALKVRVSWAAVVQLASQLGKTWVPGPRLTAWITEQFIQRFTVPDLTSKTRADAPPPMMHQVVGARMIAATGRALVFDDPGTGKTLTSIMGVLELWERGRLPIGPVVVVCPASVQDPWIEAWTRWTDKVAVAWRGSPGKRKKLIGSADVYVASYGTASRDADPHTRAEDNPLEVLAPVCLIIDETHKLKNADSLQSRAVRRLAKNAQSVIALSGTPITHNAIDLHPTLNALEPWAWPSKERYVTRYVQLASGDYQDKVLGLNKDREPEFRDVLKGQYRRLAKADVLDLPPKVYSRRDVELPAPARKAYDTMERTMLAALDNGQELDAMSEVTQLLRLLQLSCASADVELEHTGEFDDYGDEKVITHVHLREPSWKVDAFMEILDERRGQQQVVAFAPSRQLVELAGRRAQNDGYRVGYVVGGQSAKVRTAQVDAFQAGELDVLCVTTSAGGVGITLTAASTAVFLQRPWSYVEASQAEDRCHRIGSERHSSIEIIDIVAKDTIDSRVRDVLRQKSLSLAELLEDPEIARQCLGGAS